MSGYIFILLVILSQFLIGNDEIVRIIATSNVIGETDPCGWKKKPLGGLARKATVLNQEADRVSNFFVADAGNLFFSKNILEPGISKETAIINADIILNSFNEMGCSVFSPGSKDFAAGSNFLLSLSQKANFPFISSNIYDLNNNLLFDPYVILNNNNLKVAFIGLTSIFENDNIIVKDPIESLKYIVAEVSPISDIIILLFNSVDSDINKIQNEPLNITMIIRSNSTKGKQGSFDGGLGIPTYSLGEKGKVLYTFDLNILNRNLELIDIDWCERTIERNNVKLYKMKKGDMLIDLRQLFKDDSVTLSQINRYENNIESANQKLENAVNTISLGKIELGKSVSGEVDILKVVDQGKLKIKQITSPQLDSQDNVQRHSHPHDHDGDGIPDH